MASFVSPYALMGWVGCDSVMGVSIGSPKTAAVDEKTKWRTFSAIIASQYRHRAGDIVAIVTRRVPHRIADRQPGGKVHDRIDLMFAHRGAKLRGVVDVADHDRRRVTGGLAMPGGQVVEHDDRYALGAQRLDGVTADVTGSAL